MERVRRSMMCVCPKCGYSVPNFEGTPCAGRKCPECGSRMLKGQP